MTAVLTSVQRTRQIIELLRFRHEPPEWATFAEITTGTGTAGFNRRIDFYAFNIWPSKKYLRIAYEIKASRSDFNRELGNPEKRDPAEQVANECFFVMPSGTAKVDEIPEGWGLIELTKGGLRKKKNAKYRILVDLPIWFTAAIARRSVDDSPELPKALWLKAGQEIDHDGLVQAANENMGRIRWEVREEIEAEIEQKHSEELERLRELAKVIRREMGYEFAEPAKLRDWCQQNLDGRREQRLDRIIGTLRRVQNDINDLLDERND